MPPAENTAQFPLGELPLDLILLKKSPIGAHLTALVNDENVSAYDIAAEVLSWASCAVADLAKQHPDSSRYAAEIVRIFCNGVMDRGDLSEAEVLAEILKWAGRKVPMDLEEALGVMGFVQAHPDCLKVGGWKWNEGKEITLTSEQMKARYDEAKEVLVDHGQWFQSLESSKEGAAEPPKDADAESPDQ